MTFGFSSIKKYLKKAENWGENTVNNIYNKAKHVANTIYSDGKSVISFVGNQFEKNADTARGLVTNVRGSASHLIDDTGWFYP